MPHGVVLVVPLLLDVAAKADFHGAFGHLLQPDAAAGQPGVGQLGLPAVHQLLAEQAVAQARVGLLLVEVIQLDAVVRQGLAEVLLQAQVAQVVAQGTPQQELHAQVVNLLGAGFLRVLYKLGAALGQQLPHDEGACLVVLLIGGVFQGDSEGVGQPVADGHFNLLHAHCIIHLNTSKCI